MLHIFIINAQKRTTKLDTMLLYTKMIIVLHGWGQSKEVWQSFIDSIDYDKAVALDFPGFGKEPLIDDNWGVPDYANWLEQKIMQLNTDKSPIILLGHSFGGRVSVDLAARNPEWLKAVILCGTPALYNPNLSTKLKIWAAKIFKLLKLNKIIKTSFKSEELSEADKSGLGKIFRKVVVFDQTESLKKIKVPTLLLWGSKDTAAPVSMAQKINNLIENSQLEIIQDAAHQTIQESPYLSHAIIKKFIQGN